MGYDNTNSGALFRNENKKSEKSPEFSGTINADGKEYWLAGWVKESKAGKKFFSLSLTAKDEQSQTTPQPEPAGIPDDIPF